MKNYVFKKQGIVVKAKSERQAREIYNQYLHDSSDLGVAEFLKRKGIKFSKIDGTKGNIVIKFDNEKDWTLGSKHLRTKYGRKGYESIKEGNSYKVILGDSLTEDAYVYSTNASTLMTYSFAKRCVEKFGGKVAAKNGYKYVYVAPDKNTAEKAKTFLETNYSSILPSVKFIVGDSFNDDSLSDIITYYKKLKTLNYNTSEKEIFNLLNEGSRLATLAEKHVENTAKHLKERIYEKENATSKTYVFERNLRFNLADISNFFKTQFERETLSEWENGRIIGKRFPSKHSSYMNIAQKLSKRFFEIYKQYNTVFKDSFMNDNFFEDLRSADKIADYGWTLEERHEVAKDFFNESLEKGLTFEQAVKKFDTFLNDVKKEFNKKIDVAKKHFVNMKRDYIDKSRQ